jgi:hypothetical protein
MRDSRGTTQIEEDVAGLFNPRGSRTGPHSEISLCENCGAVLIPQHGGISKPESRSRICIVCGHQNKSHV